jgi:DNA-binding NarL/FixJ family response regulator
MNRIQMLLVDNSGAFLCAVTELLGREPQIEVVGTARSAGDAIEQARRLRPDFVLMDVSLAEVSGFEATHDSEAARREASSAGAVALIAKRELTESLLPLVGNLVAGVSVRVDSRTARPNRRETGPRKVVKRAPRLTVDP